MLAARGDIPFLQSDFYRIKYHKILRWVIYSIFISWGLMAFIIYLVLFEPVPSYYANTLEGRVLPMPNMHEEGS